MKCMKCHNTLHSEIGEFSMTINGKGKLQAESPVCNPKLPFCNLNSCFVSKIPDL